VSAAARIALLVVISLAVALTANLVLLDIANGPKDPVGQLNPRAGIVRLPAPVTTTTQAPSLTQTVHVTTTAPVTATTQAPTPTKPAPVPAPPRGSDGPRGSHQDD